MASVDPNLPVISVRPLNEQVAGQFRQQRLIARLTSFFGVLSLVLASIGLYGVTAYNAGHRINEIGVRMALGANRRDVLTLILRGAFGLILFGLLLGLPLTFAAGRFLGQSALRHESIRSRGDVRRRGNARAVCVGRIFDSGLPGQCSFAARSLAHRVIT